MQSDPHLTQPRHEASQLDERTNTFQYPHMCETNLLLTNSQRTCAAKMTRSYLDILEFCVLRDPEGR